MGSTIHFECSACKTVAIETWDVRVSAIIPPKGWVSIEVHSQKGVSPTQCAEGPCPAMLPSIYLVCSTSCARKFAEFAMKEPIARMLLLLADGAAPHASIPQLVQH
jgi:hypothetical protein